MPRPISDEEKEEIGQLLKDDVPIERIQKETGRSRATVYRISNELGLSVTTESDLKATREPYDVADVESYTASRKFIKDYSRDAFDQILDVGRFVMEKHQSTCREYDMTPKELVDRSLTFLMDEGAMILLYKQRIQEQNQQLEIFNAQLNRINLMRDFMGDLFMKMATQGREIDYNGIVTMTRAYMSMLMELGEYENVRRERTDEDSKLDGYEPQGADADFIEATEPGNNFTDDEPTPEPEPDDLQGTIRDANDDADDEGAEPEPTTGPRDNGTQADGKGPD